MVQIMEDKFMHIYNSIHLDLVVYISMNMLYIRLLNLQLMLMDQHHHC